MIVWVFRQQLNYDSIANLKEIIFKIMLICFSIVQIFVIDAIFKFAISLSIFYFLISY